MNLSRPWCVLHVQKTTWHHAPHSEYGSKQGHEGHRCEQFHILVTVQWKQMIDRRKMKKRRMCIAIMALCGGTSVQRSVWMRSRSHEKRDCDMKGFSETDFIQNFKMTRAAFNYICQCLSSRLSRNNSHLRRPISLEKCIDVGLYWLGSKLSADTEALKHCPSTDCFRHFLPWLFLFVIPACTQLWLTSI